MEEITEHPPWESSWEERAPSSAPSLEPVTPSLERSAPSSEVAAPSLERSAPSLEHARSELGAYGENLGAVLRVGAFLGAANRPSQLCSKLGAPLPRCWEQTRSSG